MKKDIGLFAVYRNIRSTARRNRIWWSRNVLIVFVFFAGLCSIGLDRLYCKVNIVIL